MATRTRNSDAGKQTSKTTPTRAAAKAAARVNSSPDAATDTETTSARSRSAAAKTTSGKTAAARSASPKPSAKAATAKAPVTKAAVATTGAKTAAKTAAKSGTAAAAPARKAAASKPASSKPPVARSEGTKAKSAKVAAKVTPAGNGAATRTAKAGTARAKSSPAKSSATKASSDAKPASSKAAGSSRERAAPARTSTATRSEPPAKAPPRRAASGARGPTAAAARGIAVAQAQALAPGIPVNIGSAPQTKFRGDPNLFGHLVQEHDRHRALLSMVEASPALSDERKHLFEELTYEVKGHAAAEEQALWATILRNPDTTEFARHAVAEHKEIDDLLADLAARDIATPAWNRRFAHFKERYLHHIREEEQEQFVESEKHLSKSDVRQMRDVYRRRKSEEKAGAEIEKKIRLKT